MNTKAVSKRDRFEVFKRDGFRCQYCGRTQPDVTLEVDHIIPRCKGGLNSQANLITSCADCNSGKSGVPLTQVPEAHDAAIEERKAKLEKLKTIAELSTAEADAEKKAVQSLAVFWRCLEQIDETEYSCAPHDFDTSIRRFLNDLTVDQIAEMMKVAFASSVPYYRRFRYFCGCCWKQIRGYSVSDRMRNEWEVPDPES